MSIFRRLFGTKAVTEPVPQERPEQPLQMSERLSSLAFLALDHGINSIRDGAGPLIPFVIAEQQNGERKLSRFMSDRLEECVVGARDAVSKLPSDSVAYAMAYDGYVTMEGTKYDAVFVEASERGRGQAVKLLQRYVPKTEQQEFQQVGNSAYVGECESGLR